MYKATVIAYFDTAVNLASFLKIDSAAVSQWGEIIPEKRAARLEKMTNGDLRYDINLYPISAD